MADQEAKIDLGIAGLGPAEHIGRGGFADVYRAEQLSLRRTVAVKVLRAQATDPEAEARFQRECHAIGAVSDHPHIVGVHEGGFTSNGRAYLVMEYLPGGSLQERLAAYGPMSVSEVVDTAAKIGKALAVAHRTGVLHRDIKPANIMISAYGEPALGDFGIARIEGGHRTATGLVTASFAHAAPEVLEGREPTPGADIYSLGSTMFELLTGRPPYFDPTDESIWPLMKRILSEPMPSPESIGMSPRLGAVFARATARNVGERYHDAEDLVEDLTLLASDPLALTLYPPSGDGPPAGAAEGGRTDLGDEGRGPAGAKTLVGGLPLGAAKPPATKPDLTSVQRVEPDTEVMAVEPPGPSRSVGTPSTVGGDALDDTMPAATTMDLPPSATSRPNPTAGRSGWALLAIMAGLVLALAAAGGFYLSNRSDEPVGSGSAPVAVLRDLSAVEVDGPLRAGERYTVDVAGTPPGARLRVLIDGEAAGATATTSPVAFDAVAGRHSVAVEVATDGGTERSEPLATYAIGGSPQAGFRAYLASIHVDRQGWDTALAVFDRLIEEGHADLELMATDDIPELTPGYWAMSVGGFGDDAEAAEAYCGRFDLAIPVDCYAGFLAAAAP